MMIRRCDSFSASSSRDCLRSSRSGRGAVALAAIAATGMALLGCLETPEMESLVEAPAAPVPFLRAELDGFDAQIEQALKDYGVPGAAVVVVYRDHAVFSGGFGLRHVDRGQPMEEDSLFRIGGVSTLLSSTMLATLVDEKTLDWHGPAPRLPARLSEVLVEEPQKTASVDGAENEAAGSPDENLGSDSPRHREPAVGSFGRLLSRAAMIADPFGDPVALVKTEDGEVHDTFTAATHEALLSAGQGGLAAFPRLMTDRVFRPAGMSRSAVADQLPTLAENFVTPYALSLEGGLVEVDFSESVGGEPSAGIVSTAGDLGRFLIVHLRDGVSQSGQRVASVRNLEAGRRALYTVPPRSGATREDPWPLAETCCGAGTGWRTATMPGDASWLGAEGGIEGFVALLGMLPERELGLVVLANLDARLGGKHFAREVRDIFLARILDRPGTIAHSLDHRRFQEHLDGLARRASDVGPAAAQRFLGSYEDGWQAHYRAGELGLHRAAEFLPLRGLGAEFVVNRGPRLGSRVRFERHEGRAALVFASPAGESQRTLFKLD